MVIVDSVVLHVYYVMIYVLYIILQHYVVVCTNEVCIYFSYIHISMYIPQ